MRLPAALFLCLCTLAAAQTPAPASAPASSTSPVFTAQAVRAHVEFLADDLLEGRRTGTRGYEIAARYVASQLASHGLQPAGTDGFLQRVTFQRTAYVRDRAFLTLRGPQGETRFAHGADVLVGLDPRRLEVSVEAPLVFVGYGIRNALLKIDDYRGLDVKGKIVVALSGYPRGMPSEEGAHLNTSKIETAEQLGAVGFLSVRTLLAEKTRPWKRVVETAFEPDFSWVGPDGVVDHRAPGVIGRGTVHTSVAQALFAGAPRTLESVLAEADREGGRPRGFALKTRARIESAGTAERVTSPNVAAVLPGADPALAAEHVVLLAHLDHLGVAEDAGGEPGADRIHNGALDNAAGVATMLEVARAMASAPVRPRRSILFLAVTAEEEGLLGTEFYARHPTVPIRQIVGAVGLDMPLLLYPFTDVIAFGANHSTLGPLVSRAAGTMGIALSPDPFPQEGIFTRSDHYMLVRQGVPAVLLVTGFANGGEQAWGKFLSGPYHHPNDDLSQAIDWQAGARFAEVNYRITREMADADAAPRWNEGDFFGETFAPQATRRH